MFLPALLVIWIDSLRAERASSSACWLRSDALVALKFIHKEHRSTFWAEFVLVHVLAFLKEVLFNMLDLDDLLTLPAAGEHRALFPVVNIYGFLIEGWVLPTAEGALVLSLFYLVAFAGIVLASSIIVLLIVIISAVSLFASWGPLRRRLLWSFADVGLDRLLPLRSFLWLLGW